MTDVEREINRLISYISSCREANIDCTVTIDKRLTHGVLNTLKEIQQYREIGTVEEFRKAVDRNNSKRPVWKNGRSIIFKDYADGHGEVEESKWADWVCPECGWFVGEQYLPRQHNQSKCNFCPKCGQAIKWEN